MKNKLDFVTNSSSASICLLIKTSCKNIEDFREKFNEYIEQYKSGEWGSPVPIHFWDGSKVTKTSDGWFQVEDYTSMFNYATDDIPHYMQALYLSWLVDPKNVKIQLGFEKLRIKVNDEH
jgi:hypothetical protein